MNKKLLLGTSALCAVAMAAAAQAQTANEPIKLGIGGYLHAAYGNIVSENGTNTKGLHRDDIKQDNVLNIKGSTKLDNGITAGASIQIRAENLNTSTTATQDGKTGLDTIKRAYGFLRGAYGEVRLGDDDDARRQMAFAAPVAASGDFGANSPGTNFSNNPVSTNSTFAVLANTSRTDKIVYFTPTIAGFSFAASYSPTGDKGHRGGGTNSSRTTPGQVSNELSAAGNYSGKFGDFQLDAYTGVSSGTREAPAAGSSSKDNPLIWAIGSVVGWGPFKFGGAYEEVNNARQPATGSPGHLDNKTFDVGALYGIGPFSVALDWTRGSYNGFAGSTTGGSQAVLNIINLNAAYVLGPGVQIEAAIDYEIYRSHVTPTASAATQNYSGLALMAGYNFTF